MDGLTCRRGGRTVFSGLSLALAPGELVHLSGRNGSGKSTLLRALAGLLPWQGGTVRLAEASIRAYDLPFTAACLYAGHQHGLKKALTLRENSSLFARLMTGNLPTQATLEKAADHFSLGLLLNQPVKFFSSGQAHRAALMRFMLVPRPVWLMDEPTVGLDRDNREKLTAMMEDHLGAGGSILAASHDPLGLSARTLDMAAFAPARQTGDMWS